MLFVTFVQIQALHHINTVKWCVRSVSENVACVLLSFIRLNRRSVTRAWPWRQCKGTTSPLPCLCVIGSYVSCASSV